MVKRSAKKALTRKFKKDVNAPKKPLTAYFIFMNEKRVEFKKQNPDLKVTEIGKALGEKWRALTKEEKDGYVEQSKELRVKYEKIIETYNKSAEKKEYEIEKRKHEEQLEDFVKSKKKSKKSKNSKKSKSKKSKKKKVETESEKDSDSDKEDEDDDDDDDSDTEDSD